MFHSRPSPSIARRATLITIGLAIGLWLSPALAQEDPVTFRVAADFVEVQIGVPHDRSILRIAGPDNYALTLRLDEPYDVIEAGLLLDAEPRVMQHPADSNAPASVARSALPPGVYHYEVIIYSEGAAVGRADGIFHVDTEGVAFDEHPPHQNHAPGSRQPAAEDRLSETAPGGRIGRAIVATVNFLLPAAHAQALVSSDFLSISDASEDDNTRINLQNITPDRNLGIQNRDGNFRFATGVGPDYSDILMQINRNGNIGIGTTAPQSRLHISDGDLRLSPSSGAAWDLNPGSEGLWLNRAGEAQGVLKIQGNAPANSIVATNVGLGLGTANPHRQLHLSGSNAVFRMDRSTNTAAFLMVRTDAGGNPLKTFVVGTNASGTNNGEFIINDLGTEVGAAGARRMTITNNGEAHFTGTVRAPAFVQTSSARLKENISTLEHASDALQRLRGVRYIWKESGRPSVGLIAEEVHAVYPELVETDNGHAAAINYSALIGVLVEAHKEQQQTIAHFTSEMAAQEARIAHLEAKLAGYENLSAELHTIRTLLFAQHLQTASSID